MRPPRNDSAGRRKPLEVLRPVIGDDSAPEQACKTLNKRRSVPLNADELVTIKRPATADDWAPERACKRSAGPSPAPASADGAATRGSVSDLQTLTTVSPGARSWPCQRNSAPSPEPANADGAATRERRGSVLALQMPTAGRQRDGQAVRRLQFISCEFRKQTTIYSRRDGPAVRRLQFIACEFRKQTRTYSRRDGPAVRRAEGKRARGPTPGGLLKGEPAPPPQAASDDSDRRRYGGTGLPTRQHVATRGRARCRGTPPIDGRP